MKILLTGATGFIGSHIFDLLEMEESYIRVISRPESAKNLKQNFPSEQIIITDNLFTENHSFFCELLEDIDIIIHTAWYAESGKSLQSHKNLECLSGTISLAKAAINEGVKKFVGIGTCFEYLESTEPLTVNDPLDPQSIYASSKASCYLTLKSLFNEENINFAWCRLFHLHGEREHPNRLVPYLKSQFSKGKVAKLTNGDQIRDSMKVEEAAKIIIDVALGEQCGPINVCSGMPISIRDLAHNIASESNAEHLLSFGERDMNYYDPPVIVGKPNYE